MKFPSIFYAYLTITCLVVSGCSTFSDKKEEAEVITSPKKEHRITILDTPEILQAEPEALTVDIILPRSQINRNWFATQHIQNPLLPLKLKRKHKIDIGAGAHGSLHLPASPIISNKAIFTMDADKRIRAYNIKTYKKLWGVELVDSDNTLPGGGFTFFKDRIYITLGHNIVYALNADNGKLIWKHKINGIARSTPAINYHTVVVTTIDNQTYALNPNTGNIQWIHTGINESTSTLGSPTPALHDNIVIVPHSSGEIYALTLHDGKELWSDNVVLHSVSSHTLSDIDTSPLIDGNSVYINSYSGMLAAFELYSGRRIWERKLKTAYSPWLSGNSLYVLTDKAELICLVKETGYIKWITKFPRFKNPKKQKDPIHWTRPIVANNHIWLANSHGSLTKINAITGTKIDTFDVNDDIFTSPAIANKQLYLLQDNATLHILGKK